MNNAKYLISIVIPVYKVEKYLRRCIESVLSQTYKHYELILVDDGSPDSCPSICDEYASIYKNITVIHKENEGVSVARNSGIEVANGEYITFIDSDDFVDERFLEILKMNLDIRNVSISMCSYKRVNDSSSIVKSNKNEVKVINDLEAMNMLLDDQSKCAPWGKLYNINLFKDLHFPVGKIMEDMFIMPIIFERAGKLAVSTEELYFYNQEGESITRSIFNYSKLDMVDAAAFWKKHTGLYYPELLEKASVHFFNVIINNCMYLTKMNDDYGKSKYDEYKDEILKNYKFIINSKYTTRNTRIKVFLLKFNLFRLMTKLM